MTQRVSDERLKLFAKVSVDGMVLADLARDLLDARAEIKELRAEIKDWEQSFDLYDKGERRAAKMWQEKTGETLVWPDKAKQTIFLLERIKELEAEIERLRGEIDVAFNRGWEAAKRESNTPQKAD